ncbi:MAG: YlbF family regulator [Tissierellia bacterium]|nr:YlbF family regulator [Tissierellia bacterium]
MNNVYDLAHQLARAIKDSDEYKSFMERKDALEENERNKEMVEDFQEQILQLQIDYMSGKDIDEEEIEKIGKLEEVLTLNPIINSYFQAELRFSQMIQDINGIIGEAIDIE